MRKFIFSEITQSILKQTHAIFSTIKEGILEILDERVGVFRYGIVAMVGACFFTFKEFWACKAPKFFRKKDPIESR